MTEDSLHREIIEEHAKNPQFKGKLKNFSHCGFCQSPKTGNQCNVQLLIEDETIVQVGYGIQGSALSTAIASIMSCEIVKMKIAQTVILAEQIIESLERNSTVLFSSELCVYESIRNFPECYDCALLAWRALLQALKE